MTNDDVDLMAFAFYAEMGEWKLLEHKWDNVHAVRSCGKLEKLSSADDAKDFIKRQSVLALLTCHHTVLSKRYDQ